MQRVLMFGAGVQTTALAILISQGEVIVDRVIFADTGAEKPETMWYIENYTRPLLKDAGLEIEVIRNEQPYYQPDLYGFLWRIQDIPSLHQRRCTDHFKIRPIDRYVGKDCIKIFGFSLDEMNRANRSRHRYVDFPLIKKHLTATDCRYLIQGFGLPIPLKSSCYFCPFQHPTEWNWLKTNHSDLFKKALELEANFHAKKTVLRKDYGLLRGAPLKRLEAGLQPEMFLNVGGSCWSGHCGH